MIGYNVKVQLTPGANYNDTTRLQQKKGKKKIRIINFKKTFFHD